LVTVHLIPDTESTVATQANALSTRATSAGSAPARVQPSNRTKPKTRNPNGRSRARTRA